jgi:hypothetical protein
MPAGTTGVDDIGYQIVSEMAYAVDVYSQMLRQVEE